MILGFNPRFKKPINNGLKIHTIRLDKHNRWCAGKQIHFATGVRTKSYDNFKKALCTSVQYISISYKEVPVGSVAVCQPDAGIELIQCGMETYVQAISDNESTIGAGEPVYISSINGGVPFVKGCDTLTDVSISVDGRRLSYREALFLAKNDGFIDLADFLNWFKSDFTGKIIHWTNFKY